MSEDFVMRMYGELINSVTLQWRSKASSKHSSLLLKKKSNDCMKWLNEPPMPGS